MEYVKMYEMLSPKLIKALTDSMDTGKDEPDTKEEIAEALKEYMKEDKKPDKKKDKWDDSWDDRDDKKKDKKDDDCCCPEKIKFIFVLNNAVVINVNAACEEERQPA